MCVKMLTQNKIYLLLKSVVQSHDYFVHCVTWPKCPMFSFCYRVLYQPLPTMAKIRHLKSKINGEYKPCQTMKKLLCGSSHTGLVLNTSFK